MVDLRFEFFPAQHIGDIPHVIPTSTILSKKFPISTDDSSDIIIGKSLLYLVPKLHDVVSQLLDLAGRQRNTERVSAFLQSFEQNTSDLGRSVGHHEFVRGLNESQVGYRKPTALGPLKKVGPDLFVCCNLGNGGVL